MTVLGEKQTRPFARHCTPQLADVPITPRSQRIICKKDGRAESRGCRDHRVRMEHDHDQA